MKQKIGKEGLALCRQLPLLWTATNENFSSNAAIAIGGKWTLKMPPFEFPALHIILVNTYYNKLILPFFFIKCNIPVQNSSLFYLIARVAINHITRYVSLS